MNDRVAERTIADFGQQWTAYRANGGYYGSLDLLRDMFGPLLSAGDLAGRRVLDIGSGTGRIVSMRSRPGPPTSPPSSPRRLSTSCVRTCGRRPSA
jgi:hypothetical protein